MALSLGDFFPLEVMTGYSFFDAPVIHQTLKKGK
jgi:hypothetical protein